MKNRNRRRHLGRCFDKDPAAGEKAGWQVQLDTIEAQGKVFVGTAEQIQKELKETKGQVDTLVLEGKKRDEWMREIDGKRSSRFGDSNLSTLAQAIPERHRRGIDLWRRRGVEVKEAIRRTMLESILKTQLFLERPKDSHRYAELKKEIDGMRSAMGEAEIAEESSAVVRDAMTTRTGPEGGYFVPSDFEASLLRVTEDQGILRQLARMYPMLRPEKLIPSLATGVTVYIVDETQPGTESVPTLGMSVLKARKIMGLGTISSEELQDAAVGAYDTLVELFGEKYALLEDAQGFEGDGIGVNFVGAVTALTSAQEVQAAIAGSPTNGGPPTYADLVTVKWKGRRRSTRRGASWVSSPEFARECEKLVDSQGRPLLVSPFAGAASSFDQGGRGDGILLGFPLYVTTQVSATRTVGSASGICTNAYFGPWDQALGLGDVLGIQFGASEHVNWTSDQISVRMIKRTAIATLVPGYLVKYTGVKTA